MTPNARRLSLVIGCLVIGGTAAAFAWFSMQAASGAARASEPLQCTLATPTATSPHPGMAWVPPGRFRQGDTREPEERIIESTQVSGFWMDRTEVTNAQFAEFVRATGFRTQAERPLDASKHPELPASLLKPGALVFTPPRSVNTMANPAQWWTYLPGASWQQPGGNATSIATRGEFPVVAVTYEDAMAYARWKGRDLPSEANGNGQRKAPILHRPTPGRGCFR